MNPVNSFHLQKHSVIDYADPYALSLCRKDFSQTPPQMPSLVVSFIASLLLLSCLMSSVSSVCPHRINSVLSVAVLFHCVVLLWQTITSESPGLRKLLFMTISSL